MIEMARRGASASPTPKQFRTPGKSAPRTSWRWRPAEAWAAIPLLVVLSFLGSVAANAQSPVDERAAYERSRDWTVEIDGEATDRVDIFYSESRAAWVVDSPDLGLSPLLIRAPEEDVIVLDDESLSRHEDRVDVALTREIGAAASAHFTTRPEAHFELDGQVVVLKPALPLLGFQSSEGVDARHVEFPRRRNRYQHSSVNLLKREAGAAASLEDGEQLTVRVYFGSWSSACRRIVPKIQAVEEVWKRSGVRFEYYGLPQPLIDDQHAVDQKIRGVPTVLLLRDGEEIGRLSGRPLDSPAESLLELLTQR